MLPTVRLVKIWSVEVPSRIRIVFQVLFGPLFNPPLYELTDLELLNTRLSMPIAKLVMLEKRGLPRLSVPPISAAPPRIRNVSPPLAAPVMTS